MLSRLYYYATIAYIGGGFTKSGIHNTLEAAVFAKPVIFGPNYQKYSEAIMLTERGGAFSFNTKEDLTNLINKFITNPIACDKAGTTSSNFIQEQRGATQRILNYIQENRLLTS
jgi:3-deoxy-D-manno-octulosonic-acid transferase